jgi:hypothetical protein
MPDSCFTQQLAALLQLSKSTLCDRWRQNFKRDPPLTMRREVMIRVIAYRLQEQAFGGLTDVQLRRLRHLASALDANPNAAVSSRPPIKPGTRLVRQWKQQVHTVEVEAKGYQYKGAHYESLSEVVRLITGSRWSGPLFFGLKAKAPKESTEVR